MTNERHGFCIHKCLCKGGEMNAWLESLRSELAAGRAMVRVVVAAVRGSAPREAGACMLVGEGSVTGTIGGGHLEWKSIGIARQMLASGAAGEVQFDRLSLGATLGQCCGGVVDLWFERFDAADLAFIEEALAASRCGEPMAIRTVIESQVDAAAAVKHARPVRTLCSVGLEMSPDAPRAVIDRAADGRTTLLERIDPQGTPLWIFGAGHVGSALVRTLADLPLRITWVDSREEEFTARFPHGLPGHVTALLSDSPAEEVRTAPAGAYCLVLTHSHDLDYDICCELLKKGDFAWAGLIGSKTKAAKFVHRLERQGFSKEQIKRINCPIGVDGIDSKLPAAIAVAVAAQVLRVMEAGVSIQSADDRGDSKVSAR
jgi:xanthine dehydrogenase accessory factor